MTDVRYLTACREIGRPTYHYMRAVDTTDVKIVRSALTADRVAQEVPT